MLASFRSFFQSRLGVVFTLGFLALIAIAFASADMSGNQFGGGTGGDNAATVGSSNIGTAMLKTSVTSAFDQQRQENPSLTMKQFLAAGALDQVLDDMIAREAVMEFGKAHGMAVSHRLIDSELLKIPAFLGPDGKFSEAAYRQLLAQRGLSDAIVREDLSKGLIARQVLLPAGFGATLPTSAISHYVSLFKERRTGSIAQIPSLAFAPTTAPDEATLAKFYNANKARYTEPERRTVRYAVFDETALKNVPAPTESEVANRYKADAATYAPSELRTLTQVIAPTEAAAKAIAAEVAAGKSLEAAASGKGLAPTRLDRITRSGLSGQSSQGIADAAFSAGQGKIAATGKSALGWHIVRVDAITRNPGKTLAQAAPEIQAKLAEEKRRAALSEVSARIEQDLDNGGSLSDAAKQLGVEVAATELVTSGGDVFGKPGVKAPDVVQPVVKAAFAMEREGEPQLAELQAGTRFIVFEVGQIAPAAPAPLNSIRDAVARDFALDTGSAKAREAADKVLALVRKGQSLDAALASLGIQLPRPEAVDIGREQLMATRNVSAPMALLFSMARNSAKRLEAPGKAGWFVVAVKDIVPGKVAPGDPLLASASRELGTIAGQEYTQQLRAAIRADVGAKRNDAAVAAVRNELAGTAQ